jgi:N-acetylmuramic acid 6-phosphate (MurNAc-6-P) etherase
MHKNQHKPAKKSFVKLQINLERFKLELTGEDAHRCLQEVNKVMDKVVRVSFNEPVDDVGFALRFDNSLSDELLLNSKATKLFNHFSQVYPNYRTNRVAVENRKVVELEKRKVQQFLDFEEVKKAVQKLIFPVGKAAVKDAIIHVKGTVHKDEAQKIIDLISQELPATQLHPLFTKSEVTTHTIVEGVFFGEFEDFEEG